MSAKPTEDRNLLCLSSTARVGTLVHIMIQYIVLSWVLH